MSAIASYFSSVANACNAFMLFGPRPQPVPALPVELLTAVADCLEDRRDLASFAMASPLMHEAVRRSSHEPDLRAPQFLAKAIRYREQDIDEEQRPSVLPKISDYLGDAHRHLSRSRQNALIADITGKYNRFGPFKDTKALAPLVADSPPAKQREIVQWASRRERDDLIRRLPDYEPIAWLGRAAGGLDGELHTQLIDAIPALPYANCRSASIKGFAESAAVITAANQQKLLDLAFAETELYERGDTLQTIAKNLSRFEAACRGNFVQRLTQDIELNDHWKGKIAGEAALSMHKLEPDQRTKLLDVIFSRSDEFDGRADVIASLAGVIGRYDASVRGDILARIAELPQPAARRVFFKGFGSSYADLRDAEQHVLLEAWQASLPSDALPSNYASELYKPLPSSRSAMPPMFGPEKASIAREKDAFVANLCKADSRAFALALERAPEQLATLWPEHFGRLLQRISEFENHWDRETALTPLASAYERFDRSNVDAFITQLGNWTEFAPSNALHAFAPAVLNLEEDLQRRYFAELVRMRVTEYYGKVVAAILPGLAHASPEQWRRIERSFPQPKVDAWVPWLNKRLLKYTLYNTTFQTVAVVAAVQLRTNYCNSVAAADNAKLPMICRW